MKKILLCLALITMGKPAEAQWFCETKVSIIVQNRYKTEDLQNRINQIMKEMEDKNFQYSNMDLGDSRRVLVFQKCAELSERELNKKLNANRKEEKDEK